MSALSKITGHPYAFVESLKTMDSTKLLDFLGNSVTKVNLEEFCQG